MKPPLYVPRPLAPLDWSERLLFAEFGGVNVCHPSRDDVIEPLRSAPKFCAGRAVLIGREVEFIPPRLAKPFEAPFAREALKKCCEAEGAFRYEAGLAARSVAL